MAESQIAHGPTLAANSAPPEGDRLVAGAVVGDYVIDRFLGAGAMGEVYAGRQPVIGKRVAIKILKRELATDKEAAERFLREARAVNQVDHANVIDVFGFGKLDDGRLYLVMDLVDGKSLRQALASGPLGVDAALDILGKIADALDAAHSRGVVHRDLKPDNVMLSSSTPPQVFVLDFGIAKLFTGNATGNGTLTGKGTWLGTPGYMAPEQWSADGAGPASDRYALGVMAYELLSGALPFEAPTLPQMMEKHFRSPVPALSARGKTGTAPEHHLTLDPVLARAMAKSPDARFATARELVEALRGAAGGARMAGARRSLALPAAAGVGVLALAVVGFVVIRGGDRDQSDERDDPRPTVAPTSDTVKLRVITVPTHAKVTRDGQLLGLTPLEADVPVGSTFAIAITKPGYRALAEKVAASKSEVFVRKDLQLITGYEGIWAMPDGKLRGFWRASDDKVAIYRLATLSGDRELWRTGDLVDAPSGVSSEVVTFATTTLMSDERSADRSCDAIPHAVEYRFDPTRETFEVRAEIVGTAQKDGKCIVVSRELGEPIAMLRADRGRGDTHFTQPPVGRPPRVISTNGKLPNDSLDNAFDTKKAIDTNLPPVQTTNTVKPVKPAPPSPKVAPKQTVLDKGQTDLTNQGNKADVNQGIGKKKAPPQAQQANQPPPQAPPPNGDSQQAK